MANAIRMCINCRIRNIQTDLIRLQCVDNELVPFTQNGRSFYVCKPCFKLKEKKLLKALSRACKREIKITNLECMIDG
jgi:predicted RNA-binding protein YlxR (DUF448 family)